MNGKIGKIILDLVEFSVSLQNDRVPDIVLGSLRAADSVRSEIEVVRQDMI